MAVITIVSPAVTPSGWGTWFVPLTCVPLNDSTAGEAAALPILNSAARVATIASSPLFMA
jgi:hypothetical protein